MKMRRQTLNRSAIFNQTVEHGINRRSVEFDFIAMKKLIGTDANRNAADAFEFDLRIDLFGKCLQLFKRETLVLAAVFDKQLPLAYNLARQADRVAIERKFIAEKSAQCAAEALR